MAAEKHRAGRTQAVNDHKRSLILDAARKVFDKVGLEGASLRAIAAEAGYTPAALYFHFDSKEAIYAETLKASLHHLNEVIDHAIARASNPRERLRAAALAFFTFYAENPQDLDLGFYLFRGGMKPKGLGRKCNEELNASLAASLRPIADAAQALGASANDAKALMVELFAHATGLLLLAHTGRIRMFGFSATALMTRFVEEKIETLGKT